jgi:hypothetical protein
LVLKALNNDGNAVVKGMILGAASGGRAAPPSGEGSRGPAAARLGQVLFFEHISSST